MKVRFTQNLGLQDIATCKDKFGAVLDPTECREGSTADLPQKVYDFLAHKYPSLMETTVKAVAKDAELKGVK